MWEAPPQTPVTPTVPSGRGAIAVSTAGLIHLGKERLPGPWWGDSRSLRCLRLPIEKCCAWQTFMKDLQVIINPRPWAPPSEALTAPSQPRLPESEPHSPFPRHLGEVASRRTVCQT